MLLGLKAKEIVVCFSTKTKNFCNGISETDSVIDCCKLFTCEKLGLSKIPKMAINNQYLNLFNMICLTISLGDFYDITGFFVFKV